MVGRAWLSRYALAWLGLWTAWLAPIQLVLPEQLDVIDHAHRYRDFGIINALVGVATLIALPVFGALCDRTRSRLGRRRVWAIGGTGVYAVGLVLSGYQDTWTGLAGAWLVASFGMNAITTALTAVVADEVPDRQRGLASGAMFGPQSVGVVLGIAVVSGLDAVGRYWVLAVMLVVLMAPYLLRHRDVDPVTAVPALSIGEVVSGLGVDVRAHPDFGWAFGSRLLVNVGNALGTTYLYFFLKDGLEVADPDASLLTLTIVYLVFTLAATFIGGVASDRSGRRRVFVAAAALFQGAAALLLWVHPAMATAMVGAGLLGAGYGAFLSVDQALVTAVLPHAEDRAKDLGILNVGQTIPQAIGPLMAAGLVAWSGFGTMFLVAGISTLIGAALVYRVRSVR